MNVGGSKTGYVSSILIRQQNEKAVAVDMMRRIMMSTKATAAVAGKEKKEEVKTSTSSDGAKALVSSYWGISRPQITREDGTEWPWNCFMVSITTVLQLSVANMWSCSINFAFFFFFLVM